MSFNGSGQFNINSAGQPVVSGTVITSTAFNALTADLATGLSTCVTKDGQTVPTANLPMGGFKHTGAGVATTSGEYLVYGQNIVAGNGSFSGTLTAQGDITCANGDIHSGNSVTATGFNVTNTMTWAGNTLSSSGAANYQIIARTNGVQLNDGDTSWSGISDENCKTDFVAITGALAKLKSWRTVIGRFKTDPVDKRHPFLIAQDVQATTPEAVSQNSDGTLLLAYTKTIPDIVAAINELCALVEALEARS